MINSKTLSQENLGQIGCEGLKKPKQFDCVWNIQKQVAEEFAGYTMRMLSPAEIAQQEADYTALLQKWQPASAAKVEEILATRELVEPEPELRPEVVARLKQKMAAARQTP